MVAEFQPPEGLREIVAQALRDAGMVNGEYDDSDGQWIVETKTWQYDAAADAVLAALFEACEVREEWGVRSVVPDRGLPDYWRENRAQAEDTIAARSALGAHVRSSLIHRCALKTPVEVITAPISSTGEEKTDGR